MSSSDFLEIASGTAGRSERLFRAAISAFCALTRPSRREIAQLEDLTLPLFDSVSADGLRYAAAALSECVHAPQALVRRLCDCSVDIAAPLLARSKVLTDIDLIALIGRHGLPHARAISRRDGLHPTIANLVRALERPLKRNGDTERNAPVPLHPAKPEESQRTPGAAAESVRNRLRGIMMAETLRRDHPRQDVTLNPSGRSSVYAKLRETALTGNPAFFQTALADALNLDFPTARSLVESSDPSLLLTALRALDLGEDRAFLIAVAVFPKHFPHPQAIRHFLDSYRTLHHEAALERVKLWRADRASQVIVEQRRVGANTDRRPDQGTVLKAS